MLDFKSCYQTIWFYKTTVEAACCHSLCLGAACMAPGLHLYCTNTPCSAMLYTTAFLHRSVSSCREEQEGDLFAICTKMPVPAPETSGQGTRYWLYWNASSPALRDGL